jgi:hypothetical protein
MRLGAGDGGEAPGVEELARLEMEAFDRQLERRDLKKRGERADG